MERRSAVGSLRPLRRDISADRQGGTKRDPTKDHGYRGNMPALDREILVLVHVENRTVREASFELEIPLETAKKRYRPSHPQA